MAKSRGNESPSGGFLWLRMPEVVNPLFWEPFHEAFGLECGKRQSPGKKTL